MVMLKTPGRALMHRRSLVNEKYTILNNREDFEDIVTIFSTNPLSTIEKFTSSGKRLTHALYKTPPTEHFQSLKIHFI